MDRMVSSVATSDMSDLQPANYSYCKRGRGPVMRDGCQTVFCQWRRQVVAKGVNDPVFWISTQVSVSDYLPEPPLFF